MKGGNFHFLQTSLFARDESRAHIHLSQVPWYVFAHPRREAQSKSTHPPTNSTSLSNLRQFDWMPILTQLDDVFMGPGWGRNGPSLAAEAWST